MIRIFMIGFSQNKGGVEAYISNLCSQLDPAKYEIILSAPEMEIDGKTWIRPRNRHNYLRYCAFWRRFYRENHFDVLYFNTCDIVSIDELKFAKAADVPVRIIHAHSAGNQQAIQKKLSLFHRICENQSRKTLHRYATHMFACSKAAGGWMFDGRDYELIQNGIDLQKYAYSEANRQKCRELLSIGSAPLFGCIGRLDPEKNPLFAIFVAEELVRKAPNAKVVLIGDGELRPEVEKAIREKDLQQNVILTGAVSNVNEWMSALDCLLMPSLFEGLPFVLVEAQAAGLPCVVSSAVSREADLTGLVQFVDLSMSAEKWTELLLSKCGAPRPDTSDQLIRAGYSIAATAEKVHSIISSAVSGEM